MKTLLLALPLLIFSFACNKTAESQPASNAPRSPVDHEMSVAFREQARRAFDAVDRVPEMGSREYPHPGFDVRELDAEKAIAEAKYKASTAKDKEVLDLLDAALYGRTAVEHRHLLDPYRSGGPSHVLFERLNPVGFLIMQSVDFDEKDEDN